MTLPRSFGAICTYNGHRANVERVVTDATWHHFVNVNLIGAVAYPQASQKEMGCFFSVASQPHLEQIKQLGVGLVTEREKFKITYYRYLKKKRKRGEPGFKLFEMI